MIIAAHNIPKYLHSLQFPLDVLEETGTRVSMRVDRPILMALIESRSVIGIGTWKTIKRLRFNRSAEEVAEVRTALDRPPTGSKYSFDSATDQNPQNVWSFKEITHLERDLFMTVQTSCLVHA